MKRNTRQRPKFGIKSLTLSVFMLTQSLSAQADLTQLDFSNELERAVALATQETYFTLVDDFGCFDDVPVQAVKRNSMCVDDVLVLFENVRTLVHTANELIGDFPSRRSLGLDLEGLGFALRWTAGEEFASQQQLTQNFAGGQFATLSTRLKALRGGAQGFGVTLNSLNSARSVASLDQYERFSGGGASADQSKSKYSQWGGFINADLGSGAKSATVFEDAYDFDGTKISFGADYRLDQFWVFGLIGGIIDQEVDFDSTQSVVDGGIETDGFSLLPYVLYQSDDFYASFSVGLQKQSVDTTRAINIISLNPNVNDINTVAISSTDAQIFSLFMESGRSYQFEALTVEPFVSLSYSNTSFDAFTEQDINNLALGLSVGKQSIDSLETSLGVKLQYAWTPSWGVVIPFFDIQMHNQQENDSRNISSSFANLPSGLLDATNFNLPTDEIDSSYYSYSLGMSFILQGDTSVDAEGNASGSMQGFISYRSIESIDNFEEETVALGFRYGF